MSPPPFFWRGEPIEDATWRVAYVRFWPTLFPSSSMENMCVHTHRERVFTFGLRRGVGGKKETKITRIEKKVHRMRLILFWRSSGERWKNWMERGGIVITSISLFNYTFLYFIFPSQKPFLRLADGRPSFTRSPTDICTFASTHRDNLKIRNWAGRHFFSTGEFFLFKYGNESYFK